MATFSITLAVVLFIFIGWAGLFTDMIREGSGLDKPYSFRKFQLWVWTLVICPLVVLHWGLGPDETMQFNSTVLILLGISVGTALTGELVSNSQAEENKKKVAEGNVATTVKLKQFANTTNIIKDLLLGDGNQLSVVRLQQLVFTLIYVVIFLAHFFLHKYQYPNFDETAFVLMGISTGTYVVGKGLNK